MATIKLLLGAFLAPKKCFASLSGRWDFHMVCCCIKSNLTLLDQDYGDRSVCVCVRASSSAGVGVGSPKLVCLFVRGKEPASPATSRSRCLLYLTRLVRAAECRFQSLIEANFRSKVSPRPFLSI
jgi:hypothetical protein